MRSAKLPTGVLAAIIPLSPFPIPSLPLGVAVMEEEHISYIEFHIYPKIVYRMG
jgi:hypothetical protein